jgi:pyruvate-formate lyase-activating enzyme
MLKSTRDSRYFYIDWWLHNHCNYNCSYCPEIIKSGSINLPNLDECIHFVDEVRSHAKQQNKVCHFYFTGGEVTVWPFYTELIEYIKKEPSYISMRSNASMSIDQWNRLIDYVDAVNMEFHTEHTPQSHFLLCYSAAKKKNVSVGLTISMLPDRWVELEEMIETIKRLWPNQNIHKKMLFEDPAINKQPKNYSNEQQVKLKRQHGDLILIDNGEEEFTDYNTLLLEGKNKFKDRQCMAGIEQIIVDAWGRVARGHCRVGGHIGKIGVGYKWPANPIVCTALDCRNGFDITATKL